jgi:hypothetical protein
MGEGAIPVDTGFAGAGFIDFSGLSVRDLDERSESCLALELRRVLETRPGSTVVTADWPNCL